MRRWVPLVVVWLTWAAPAAAAPQPFGHECAPKADVRFCPTVTLEQRVPSFDGVPLDIDVTLPAAGDGPWPAIVMLHGYGNSKTDFQTDGAEGNGGKTYHYNNIHFAQRGYLVVQASARGFGRSCGDESSRTAGCQEGYIRLADQRYEARDVQHYLGLLADQGLVDPGRIGVTGVSYGGGQSLELALLRDRVRLPDDSFAPWTSPAGTPMRITAAFPRWLWSDLVASLLPNGRFLDFEDPTLLQSREPLGVPIESFITGLYALGANSGFYAAPGSDPDADLTSWYGRITAGDPYGEDVRAIADEIFEHHQGFGLPAPDPAPLLLQNGWTDGLFPVSEALRIHRALGGRPTLQFADIGHGRATNKRNADRHFNDQASAFFDHHLRGMEAGPAPGSVTAFTQTCPADAPAEGPFTAASWDRLHPAAVTYASATPQTLTSSGGDPETAAAIDPVANGGGACDQVEDEDAPGTAVYRLPVSDGWLMLGRPTVRATVRASGGSPYIASRLWDVAPDGRQTLVTRGVYRLEDGQAGEVVFQLNGNGWRFEPGHVPKLELLGQDAPFLRPSNQPFSVEVRDLRLALPRAGTAAEGRSGEQGSRRRPRLRVRVKRRGPRAFTVRGRLTRLRGARCQGRVSAQWKAGRSTISNRRDSVGGRRCRFAIRVRFRDPSRFNGRRRLRLIVRYQGSPELKRARAKTRRVRVSSRAASR